MLVKDLLQNKEFILITEEESLNFKQLESVYICDLLSWVLSHAEKNSAWITVHTHINIVAVATLRSIGCIIIPEDIKAEEATVKKANEEKIPILSTSLTGYEAACLLRERYRI